MNKIYYRYHFVKTKQLMAILKDYFQRTGDLLQDETVDGIEIDNQKLLDSSCIMLNVAYNREVK